MESLKTAYRYYGTYKSLMNASDKVFGKGPVSHYWEHGMSLSDRTGAVFAAGQLMRIGSEFFKSIPKPQQFFVVEADGVNIASLYNVRRLEMLLNCPS